MGILDGLWGYLCICLAILGYVWFSSHCGRTLGLVFRVLELGFVQHEAHLPCHAKHVLVLTQSRIVIVMAMGVCITKL